MSSSFENSAVHYGMPFSSAAVLAFVAFAFLDGTIQLIVLGLAVVKTVVTPPFLKRAAAQNDA